MSLVWVLALPFLGAVAMPVLYPLMGRWLGLAALVPAASSLGLLLARWPAVAAGAEAAVRIPWVPELGLTFHLTLDGWSFLFALLITGIGVLVVAYAIPYLGADEDLGKFYLYLLLFMGAMLGVVLSANLLLTYIFWELTSFSSFLLIGFWHTRAAGQYGALKSMLITVGGGFTMLGGLALLYAMGGSFELADLAVRAAALREHPWLPAALALILAGAFTKSAQVPFHIWLPDAMAAPTPVSAYLHAATMVKAGLFLAGRLWPLFSGTPAWTVLVTGSGLITLLLGGFLALRRTDLKAILAMSTVSQLGLIMAALGLGTAAGAAAAVFHLLNHATFKGALFLAVGIIDHSTGTRDIRRLRGLRSKLPVTFALAVVASLATAGVPPLNGFVSKEMFFAATLGAPAPWGWLAPVLAVLGSVFTVAYSLITGYRIWFGPLSHDLEQHPHEAPAAMWLPPAVLALLALLLGLAPGLVEHALVAPAVAAVTGRPAPALDLALWHGFNLPLLMGALALGAGALLYARLGPAGALLARLTPRRWHLNALYDWLWWDTRAVEGFAGWLTATHMTGLLRDYLVFTLGLAVAAVFYTMWRFAALAAYVPDLAPIDFWEAALMGIIAVGAGVATFARTRLVAITALGLVGLPLAILFALLRAPDLALTQIVVEIVTAILFLLVFAHLPQLRRYRLGNAYHAVNAVVAAGVGLMMFFVTLLSTGVRLYPPIAGYYLEKSLPEGGGKNVVNVTLVDFRGLDTQFEITVVTIAALGVYALIKLNLRSKGEGSGP